MSDTKQEASILGALVAMEGLKKLEADLEAGRKVDIITFLQQVNPSVLADYLKKKKK